MVLRAWTLAIVLGLPVAIPPSANGQRPFELRGYYLQVPLWSEATPLNAGGLADLQRLRLMTRSLLGPLRLNIAYEHYFSVSQREGVGTGGLGASVAPAGGELFDLDWNIAEGSRASWRHRLDRLSVTYAPDARVQVTVGRQAISWATTLLLTPADPFVPFDPADPFREFRAGVDAARLQFFPGALTDVDLVVRGSDTPRGDRLTALGRVRGVVGEWELSGWAGAIHERAAGGVGATGSVGRAALRVEASVREDASSEGPAFRAAAGVDTRMTVSGRDLYLAIEYQHDDFGAAGAREIVEVLLSDPFRRGELQVLGRDALLVRGTYQVHPLASAGLLALGNLRDGSALLVPTLSYGLTGEATVGVGSFVGLGAGPAANPAPIPSEFGVLPATLYASLSWFF